MIETKKKKTHYYVQRKMILYVKNSRESIHKSGALIHELGKVTGYKDNIQK